MLHILDIVGTAVFAASGALSASRKGMDIIGFCLLAAVTGIGGGTLRDVLLGVQPVSWLMQPGVILLCFGVALVSFFTAHHLESRERVLLWADAVGLAVFCVTGTQHALAAGASPIAAVLMGAVTATFGGIIRDVLCNEKPLILYKEIYVTAAAAGAVVYVTTVPFMPDPRIAEILGLLTAFMARAGGLVASLSLPTYAKRPARPQETGRP
ncbi:trimeric intracellular cation channel family protein [Rhodovastum atsumiense]|uniref:Trimeric intracellular cation channel family protein n=2 Tax=Rhodovastum atsumiense TaxID=504468 RepID=A0A5M6J3M3_9PROT|nr:trimeric intracellular cation channel family protein [Rhodovastum atsumiense]